MGGTMPRLPTKRRPSKHASADLRWFASVCTPHAKHAKRLIARRPRAHRCSGHHMSFFLLDLLVAPIVIAGLGLTPLQLVFFIPPAAGAVATVQEFLRAEKEHGHGD